MEKANAGYKRVGNASRYSLPGRALTFAVAISAIGWTFSSGAAEAGESLAAVQQSHSDHTAELRHSWYDIFTIDPPGAVVTQAVGVSDRGDVSGVYNDSSGKTHSFVLLRGETWASFDAPGADSTIATGINNRGETTGVYEIGNVEWGFYRTADKIDTQGNLHPGVVKGFILGSGGIQPYGINLDREIAGYYVDGTAIGFVRERDGTVQSLNLSAFGTRISGINDSGAVTGWATDAQGVSHGFWATGGFQKVKYFDPPGSTGTVPLAINNDDTVNTTPSITGFYTDANNHYHGFVLNNSVVTSFDGPPEATDTLPSGINDKGAITGAFMIQPGAMGFVRSPKGAFKIKAFGYPDTGMSDIFPQHINDKGVIVGYYRDSNFVNHGFMLVPRKKSQ